MVVKITVGLDSPQVGAMGGWMDLDGTLMVDLGVFDGGWKINHFH